MRKVRVIMKKKAVKQPSTTWGKIKHKASGILRNNREKRLEKAMQKGNAARVVRLMEKVGGKAMGRSIEWLGNEAEFNYKIAKKLYNKAKEKDKYHIAIFKEAYLKLSEEGKNKMWKHMGKELDRMLKFTENTDILDDELKNTAKIYVEIGKVDEKADHTPCWKNLADLACGRSGTLLEKRMFALDALQESGYRDEEFWAGMIACNGNGDGHKLAKYAIELLLRKDSEGSEELFLKNINMAAERLVEVHYSNERKFNRERLIRFFSDVLMNGTDEQKKILLKELGTSKKLHGKLKNNEIGDAVDKLLESGDGEMVYLATKLLYRIQWCPDVVKENLFRLLERGSPESKRIVNILMKGRIRKDDAERIVSAILKRIEIEDENGSIDSYMLLQKLLENKDERTKTFTQLGMKKLLRKDDELAESVVEHLLSDSEKLLKSNVVDVCVQGMKLLNSLEFTGRTEKVKTIISDGLEERIEKMFDADDVNMNLNAVWILVTLSSLEKTRKVVEEVAVPELQYIAMDGTVDDEDKEHAKAALAALKTVVSGCEINGEIKILH